MSITATELKMNLGKYLLLAESEDIFITKNGKKALIGTCVIDHSGVRYHYILFKKRLNQYKNLQPS